MFACASLYKRGVILFSENAVAKRDDVQVRRAAEREGRRIRRMKVREATKSLQNKHVDGMSSDDEVTEMEAATFKRQKGTS